VSHVTRHPKVNLSLTPHTHRFTPNTVRGNALGVDELVEAGAVRLGAPDHFGFHRGRQAERIGALGLAHDGVG